MRASRVSSLNRGQMRVIEVIIALFIIVAALTFANLLSIAPSSPNYQATELQKLGYNVLHDLDKQNLLPEFVYDNQWQNLTAALRVILPINVYFQLNVYQIQRTTTVEGGIGNNYVIVNLGPTGEVRYGDSAIFSSAKNIASVTYSLVGYPMQIESIYSPRMLVLQLIEG